MPEAKTTERVVMMWPRELKEAVREASGHGGMTDFAIQAVRLLLAQGTFVPTPDPPKVPAKKKAAAVSSEVRPLPQDKTDELAVVPPPQQVVVAEVVRSASKPTPAEVESFVALADQPLPDAPAVAKPVAQPATDRDDLFARVMAKTGGALTDVPGLKLASEIEQPPPMVQKDLCGTCSEELIDGECWTCAS